MMDIPICDFVSRYQASQPLRLHMPGHKGQPFLGPEALDITEIEGADVLYDASGVIQQSQQNAQALFGTGKTLYSTEGSSLCIRAMLYLAMIHAREQGRRPLIAAARNAHKVFITASALLDLEVCWLYPRENGSVVSCELMLADVEKVLQEQSPAALYVTSPDYLGRMADVLALSALCRQYGTLLLVDNAHGAYLHFLPKSLHPMDLGADLCCDSAHKTLPVLTGGAYLHIASSAPKALFAHAEIAMKLFASTSPSYLILQSLDCCNRYLADAFSARLAHTAQVLSFAKERLMQAGWQLCSQEPLKLTLAPKSRGYTGDALAALLSQHDIVCEFADPDHLVLMFTPSIEDAAIHHLIDLLCALPTADPITAIPPVLNRLKVHMSPREALFSPQERILAAKSEGRTLASPSVTCPPAVPIAVCGEELDASAAACFAYYGVESVWVVQKNDSLK